MNKMAMNLPSIPYEKWKDSYRTLHLFVQIIGKVRMQQLPNQNHWWHLTLYVTPNGLSTHGMPYDEGREQFKIELDFRLHRLKITTSQNKAFELGLENGLSVAKFYRKFRDGLEKLVGSISIIEKPFDLSIKERFSEIVSHHHYNKKKTYEFWKVLLWVDGVFKEFSTRFYGKQCPVHIYWHHFDLTVTRFSGEKASLANDSASALEKDAYSHKIISFGFWAGDDNVREPAFYSYTYPAPKNIEKETIEPEYAKWVHQNGSPMALLSYQKLRKATNPRKHLLAFLQSTYEAGATLAGWDIDKFKYTPFN